MKGSIHHIGLFTAKPEELIEFYTKKLGFALLGTKVVSAYHMEQIFGLKRESPVAKLKRQDVILELFSPGNIDSSLSGEFRPGLNHWGIEVESEETFLAEMLPMGVDIFPVDFNGRIIHFIRDPDGNLIEICESVK
ncbi:VOC family protein [Acidobacteriota bacterium]